MATVKDITEYSYEELKKHLDGLKQSAIEATGLALDKARQGVIELEKKLEELTGISLTPTKTRGRKKGTKNKAPIGKPSKGKSKGGKRGGLKEKVLAYLSHGPQPIKSIVIATKGNYGSVFQTLNNLRKEKRVTKGKERGAPYTLVK